MYKVLAIGGTFDRLHKGHWFFIQRAFKLGRKVIIGLTSDQYVIEKLKATRHPGGVRLDPEVEGLVKIKIQNYQKREKELTEFLKDAGLWDRTKIVKIDDVYGSAIENSQIEALLVTSETIAGARMINKRRKERGLPPLKVLKAPLILAQDRRRIASTRIRIGEIDRWGRVFELKIENGKWKIDERVRVKLKKPQGILIKGNPQNHQLIADKLNEIISGLKPIMIITVGDEVTKLLNQIGLLPNLAIVDFKVRRVKIYHSLSELGFALNSKETIKAPREAGTISAVRNPPGHITKTLVAAVKKSIKTYLRDGRQRIIKVIGEEDLAGVPAILFAPLGSMVIYGQPQEGIVIVPISEDKKQKLLNLIQNYS